MLFALSLFVVIPNLCIGEKNKKGEWFGPAFMLCFFLSALNFT